MHVYIYIHYIICYMHVCMCISLYHHTSSSQWNKLPSSHSQCSDELTLPLPLRSSFLKAFLARMDRSSCSSPHLSLEQCDLLETLWFSQLPKKQKVDQHKAVLNNFAYSMLCNDKPCNYWQYIDITTSKSTAAEIQCKQSSVDHHLTNRLSVPYCANFFLEQVHPWTHFFHTSTLRSEIQT